MRTEKFLALFVLSVASGALATAAPKERFKRNGGIFQNLTLPYYSFLDGVFNTLYTNLAHVSSECRNDTQILLDLAERGDSNALKFLDSTGKPSSGILEGNIFYIGYYSECVGAFIRGQDASFNGKYCLVNFKNFSSSSSREKVLPRASWLVLTQSQKPPTIGICLPSSCSNEDLNFALKEVVYEDFDAEEAKVSICYTNENKFSSDPVAVTFLCVFLLWVSFSLFATVIDFAYPDIKPIASNGNVNHAVDNETNHAIENETINNITKNCSTEILCEQIQKESRYKKFSKTCLLAFSFKYNGTKLLSVGQGAENIRSLHGLRFLSMALIILGHTFSFATQYLFLRNAGSVANVPKSFFTQVFANGTFAVDTFYFISGVLVAYVSLKALQKTNGKLNLFYFYFHRYFRLTPLMMAVIAFCATVLRYVGSGPDWLSSITMYDSWCRSNWWLNALYLHNFFNTENMCLSHTWYLATDMQIYLVMPLILIPLYRKLKYGLLVIGIFLLITTLAPGLIIFFNNYPAIPYLNDAMSPTVTNNYYRDVYIKPYCRMGPLLVGMLVGYYFVHKKELNLKKIHVLGLWIFFLTLGLFIIYIMWPAIQGYPPSTFEAAWYGALARPAWGVSLGWLTIACFYGYAGIVNTLLSWAPLVPLSRLTYCAYLIHPVIMNVYYGCTETSVDYSQSFMIYLFLGNLCVTYALSLPLSLLFESPFVGLEKAMLSNR